MTELTDERLAAWFINPERLNDLGYLLDSYAEAAADAHIVYTNQADNRRNGIADLIQALADRLHARATTAEKTARDAGFELARQSPTMARARGWEKRVGELEAELEQARQQLTDVSKLCHGLIKTLPAATPSTSEADAIPAAPVPAPADKSWRQYTVERDSSDDGVSVLCREDGDCMENSGEDGVAFGRYLTLGEAVDWAKKHAVSIFHVDPDEPDDPAPAAVAVETERPLCAFDHDAYLQIDTGWWQCDRCPARWTDAAPVVVKPADVQQDGA